MKILISILNIMAWGTFSYAQDTAYISRNKVTALFFKGPVRIIGHIPSALAITQRESGLITLKAMDSRFRPGQLNVQEESTHRLYHIPVQYSYGRAGRSIQVQGLRMDVAVTSSPAYSYMQISKALASGKRKDIVDHEKSGGVKAWVSKLSLADGKVFLRLDIRNKSNLPYDIDFVRFYIRDLKKATRMATHEQEIVPVYATLSKRTTVVKSRETAQVFAFRRFSLSEDQALNVELYERNGNRHLYLRIRQKDLEDLKAIGTAPQRASSALAINNL